MNWQDLGSIGEMISAIAVVISLVYLAFQIRQNTRHIDQNTRAVQAAAFDSSITQTSTARQAIFSNEDVTRIYLQGSHDPDSLTEVERERYRLILHNVLWAIWNLYTQSKVADELTSDQWQAQVAILKRVSTTKGFQWFWDNYKGEFGPSFHNELSRLVDEAESRVE